MYDDENGGGVMAEKEYIEREAIQKRLNRIVEVNNLRTDLAWFTPYGVKALIEEIPAADVRPVVRGKWTMNSDFPDRLICSECGAQFDCWHWESKQMHFCPNCGADMRPTSMSGANGEES